MNYYIINGIRYQCENPQQAVRKHYTRSPGQAITTMWEISSDRAEPRAVFVQEWSEPAKPTRESWANKVWTSIDGVSHTVGDMQLSHLLNVIRHLHDRKATYGIGYDTWVGSIHHAMLSELEYRGVSRALAQEPEKYATWLLLQVLNDTRDLAMRAMRAEVKLKQVTAALGERDRF